MYFSHVLFYFLFYVRELFLPPWPGVGGDRHLPPLSRAILRTVITCAARFRHSVFTSAIGIGPVIQSYPFQRVVGTVYGDVREGGAAGGSLPEHGVVHLSLRVDRIHTHPLLLLASRPLYPRLLRRHGLDLRRPLPLPRMFSHPLSFPMCRFSLLGFWVPGSF